MTTEVEFFTRPVIRSRARIMVFVDGENLAMCYGRVLSNQPPASHIEYEPDVFVWSENLNYLCAQANVIRKHFYTSAIGDSPYLESVTDRLKEAGIEAPRVFKKSKSRSSKQVDISLTTDMLTHAYRKNYEVAVLVAGDQDYVPLVEAVQAEGSRVFLWFVEQGLSAALRRMADRYNDIGDLLNGPSLH